MIRPLAILLGAAGLLSAQFVEIEVDAGRAAGAKLTVAGIDAPTDQHSANLLLESGVKIPVRVGPKAGHREELLKGLWSAWADDIARPLYDARSIPTADSEVVIYTLAPEVGPVEAINLWMQLCTSDGPAIYYRRSGKGWFATGGEPGPAQRALELAAKMAQTPRQVSLRAAMYTTRGVAGVSGDGQTVQVLLTRAEPERDEPEPPAYLLHVRNLPWGAGAFGVERYRLDGTHEGELVEKGSGRGGLARVSARFEAPAVELIVLRRQDERPGSRVIRSRRRPRSP